MGAGSISVAAPSGCRTTGQFSVSNYPIIQFAPAPLEPWNAQALENDAVVQSMERALKEGKALDEENQSRGSSRKNGSSPREGDDYHVVSRGMYPMQ